MSLKSESLIDFQSNRFLNDTPHLGLHITPEENQESGIREELEKSYGVVLGILDTISIPILVLNNSGDIVMMNSKWVSLQESMHIYGIELYIGMNYLDLCRGLLPNDTEEICHLHSKTKAAVLGGGEKFSIELQLQTGNENQWFRITVSPLYKTLPAAAVVSHEDITFEKQASLQVQEKSKALGRLSLLSNREQEVMKLIVRGETNKTVAYCLDISPRTVEKHRANVMKKLQVKSVAELVRTVVATGEKMQATP